jgi:Uma2 family endonuclease
MSTAALRDRVTLTVDVDPRRALPLVLPHGVRPKVTYEELLLLCAANELVDIEWDPDGTLHVMSPAGAGPGRKNADLVAQLFTWARRDGTGLVFDSSAGFRLADGKMRSPDAAWVRRDRWETLPDEEREKGFPRLTPDMVVELRSPSDTIARLRKKMALYLANGVRLAWLIDPASRRVEVYRPGREVEILDDPATVSGEDVLPGFVLDLAEIFTPPMPRR